MTYWICEEVRTDNGGYIQPVKELILCKECHGYDATTGRCHWWYDDPDVSETGYCYQGVKKEKGEEE